MANGAGSENGGNISDQPTVGGRTSGNDDVIRIDPGAIDASAGNETPGVGRAGERTGPNGRKLNKDGSERKARNGGSRNTSSSPGPQASFPVDQVAAQIVAAHALLSFSLKSPELALDPREAQVLASALANLQRFYPTIQLAPKTMAWGNMFSALGLVYGGRFMAMATRKKSTAKPQAQSADNIIRPQAFQTQPQPHVTPPPQAAPVFNPDNDPVAAATPQNTVQSKASNAGENAFVNTPPEFI